MSFRESIIWAAAQRPGSRVEVDSQGRLNPETASHLLLAVQNAAAVDVTTAVVGINRHLGSLVPARGEPFKAVGETLLLHCSQAVPSVGHSTEVETGVLVEEFFLTNSFLDDLRPVDVIDGNAIESSVRIRVLIKLAANEVEQLGVVYLTLDPSRNVESVEFAVHGYEPVLGVSGSGRLPTSRKERTELLMRIARPMMAARTMIAGHGFNRFAGSGQQMELGINSEGGATLSAVGRSAGLVSHGVGL